jgi:tetratricopeptide (TPR) repeat protein
VGRERELERVKDGFASRHILVIEGMAGSGKTYLVSYFINKMEGEFGVFFKECREDLGLSSLLVELNEYLKGEGEGGFDLVLQDPKIDHEAKLRALVEILERKAHVLILDDFHNVRDGGIEDFVLFLDRFLKRTRLILISRTSPPIIKRLDPNNVEEILLEGFTEGETISYLRRAMKEEKESTLKEVFKMTGGLPLALNLFVGLLKYYMAEELVSKPPMYAKKVFNQYLIDKVFEMLSEDEVKVITRFSVFRSPVRKEALHSLYPMANWEDVVISLIDKLLLIRREEDLFSMQPLIREFAYERLEEKRRYHIVAARYYLAMEKDRVKNGLEACHHYLQAREFGALRNTLLLIGDDLIRRGDLEVAHRLITKVLETRGEGLGEIHLLLGKVLQGWGRLDEALREYEMAYEGISDLRKKALARNQIGGVYLFRGDYNRAKPFLEESLHLRREIKDTAGVAEGLHQMGVLWIGLGRYGAAKEHLLEALRMSEELQDKSAVAETLSELARIDFYNKEYDDALSHLMRAVTLSRETINRKVEATTLHNLASVYLEKGDYEEAEENFRKSLEIKERIGDKFGLAHTYHQLGNLYMERKDLPQAKRYFEKSREIFDELGSEETRYPQYFLDRIDKE